VLVPNLYLVRDGVAERFEQFVSSGGQLVMSFFSGIVDEHDHIRLGGYPAPFRRMLGVRVEEFDPYVPGQHNTLVDVPGQRNTCDLWSDVMELEGAEALATFGEDFYAGRPAITRHAFGQGTAYYLGTRPESAYMERLLADVCIDVTRLPFTTPPGVEVVCRTKDDESWWFLLNHTEQLIEVTGPDNLHDALTGNPVDHTIQLAPYNAIVLRS
jgi:beta-galactosidase